MGDLSSSAMTESEILGGICQGVIVSACTLEGKIGLDIVKT